MTAQSGRADIFISHASEDKDFARPLAEALRRRGLTVWYDEYVLRLGDSLREVIDRGLSAARFGVVILSPRFFAKEWPQRDLNGLLARETVNRTKVLLPLWHDLTFDEVVRYSPILADRLAVSTERGIDYVVEQILDVLEADRPRVVASAPPKPVKITATKPRRTRLAPRQIAIAAGALAVAGILAALAQVDWLNLEPLAVDPTAQQSSPKRYAEKFDHLRAEVGVLEDLERARCKGSAILTTVWKATPELLWLEGLSESKDYVFLQGRAFNMQSVASFRENLERSPDFGESWLLDSTDLQGDFRFVLQMEKMPPSSPSIPGNLAGLRRRHDELLLKLPARPSTSAVMRLVRSTVEQADVSLKVFRPEALEGEGLVQQWPIYVALDGTLQNVVLLLDRLGKLPFPATIKNLRLQAKVGERQTVGCTFQLLIPVSDQGKGSDFSSRVVSIGLPPELERLSDPFIPPLPPAGQ